MTNCYLCGAAIISDESADHVPPKQFFAKSLRETHNTSQFRTLPTHAACNRAYAADEEYFVWSLAPLALDSYTGGALARSNADKFKSGKSQGLGTLTLKEFERRPSGLHLPADLVVKRVDPDRVRRVVWKLVRGLYALEHGAVLPDDTPFMAESFEPMYGSRSTENPVWEIVKAEPSKGTYGAVFDYKYKIVEVDDLALHVWGMLCWDRIMFFVAHHPPTAA